MRITNHSQMHRVHVLPAAFISDYNVKFVNDFGREIDCPANIAIDQFYALEHNLQNGFVDTSPDMMSNPQAAAHIQPMTAEKPLPADITNEQLFDMVVPRKLQSPAELSRLADLRPRESDYKEPNVIVEPAEIVTNNE